MGKQPRIGIVGCGGHMFEFLYHTLKWAPPATVAAACDVDERKLDRFTAFYNVPNRYTDVRDMLENESLDAVIVAVHETAHFDIVKAALASGIDVFVEKTPCYTTAQAEELVDLQRRTGKTAMVGFNRRFMTAYVMAKEISSRPEFGEVLMYQSQFHANPYKSDERYKINHIVHHLDLARYLLGDLRLTHVERVALDDQRVGYAISFRSAKGAIGTIQSAALLDELYPMERLELIGDRRNIVVDNVKGLVYNRPIKQRKEAFAPFALSDDSDALVWNPSHGYYPRFSHHGYENEIHYFIDCVANGRKPEPNMEDSIHTMRLLDELEALLRAKPE